MAKAKKAARAGKATKATKGAPGHYTDKGTRKFQANGPIEWSKTFTKAAGGGREGEGIRSAMAYAIAHEKAFLSWAAAQSKAADKADKAAAK